MSLDSQLDRSKLERKDRDELATIVTTLGGKPGRSKKLPDWVRNATWQSRGKTTWNFVLVGGIL